MLTYVEDRFVEDQNNNHLIEDCSNLNHKSIPQSGNYEHECVYSSQYN